MPAPLKIALNENERTMLEDLRVATKIVQRTRDRAHMLLLNDAGWRVPQIAKVFCCHDSTVRATIQRWQEKGLMGLQDAPGRGVKPKCNEEDWLYLESLLEEERTYNSKQLAQKLEEQREITLSTDRLRKGLKKRGFVGSAQGIRTVKNKTQNSRPGSKQS
jgi:transposase